MSRYRLRPSPAQEAIILGHCAHARYVWNLCVEQESHWRPGRGKMPRFAGRCRQLSEARAADPVREGHRRGTRPQCQGQGRAEPGHPGIRMGPAGPPPAGQGTRPGREGTSRVHEPALLGVRAHRSGQPREPSPVPLRGLRLRLQRWRERGQEHRGGTRR